MKHKIVVVGAGMAGLTSAAYLAKEGHSVLLIEQAKKIGGLVNSFSYKSFVLDGGIRAIENAGVVFPMLHELGIDIPFVKSLVSVQVDDNVLPLKRERFREDYISFLTKLFPDEQESILTLTQLIEKAIKVVDTIYGIDNPLFVDIKNNPRYGMSLLPWLFKFLFVLHKIDRMQEPIVHYLNQFMSNQELIDVFSQHFFEKTPAFFALSFFSLYFDYHYPLGGTGRLSEELGKYILDQGGEILLQSPVTSIHPINQVLQINSGREIEYESLIWAADMKQLYCKIDISQLSTGVQKKIAAKRTLLDHSKGSESVFTSYFLLNIPVQELQKRMTAHVFYTFSKKGLSNPKLELLKKQCFPYGRLSDDRNDLWDWIKLFLESNTFEISCPAMRDESLAPKGQSALIVSFLFDHSLMEQIAEKGWYKPFKTYVETCIFEILSRNILVADKSCLQESFSSTPLTISKLTGNTDGSLTGWSFANNVNISTTKMSEIGKSIETDFNHIFQAGQWTFSPGGVPTAIITGKLASQRALKKLKQHTVPQKSDTDLQKEVTPIE